MWLEPPISIGGCRMIKLMSPKRGFHRKALRWCKIIHSLVTKIAQVTANLESVKKQRKALEKLYVEDKVT